jgi:uncharacterized protein YprB with RNaseH-like and TPR domain
VDGTRLSRRLESMRANRVAGVRAERRGENDLEIRRAIAAVVATADDYGPPRPVWRGVGPLDAASQARRLAQGLDGDAVETEHGWYVRRELRPVYLPVDRSRLADLPGMPGPATPLLCLDTETTGLGSAAGTVAFLVGLGWWDGDRLRLLQLALTDHSEEGALLDALTAETPDGGWLVTYNGRSFDWPLLETRFRMCRRQPPELDGHLDLLLLVRRLFRHRLPDARLQTVERHLLRRVRAPDIPSWEIPALYQAFLRGGPAGPIRVVARHNAEDVVTLGRLLAHLERGYGAGEARRWAPAGDLTRLARLFRHDGRADDAIECLETAAAGVAASGGDVDADAALATVELARLLRRYGRLAEAGVAWGRLAVGPGPLAALGWIELAKEREHRDRDPEAAWAATDEALMALYRSRGHGSVALRRGLESDLGARRARLVRRLTKQPA